MEFSEAVSRLVASPHRWLIVTIGTFVTGLATLLPLVDEYKDINDHKADLAVQLALAEREAAMLPRFEQRVESQQIALTSLESKAVSSNGIHAYRNRVVALIRDSGCQARRITAEKPRNRVWMKDDSPLQRKQRPKKNEESSYLLESQQFSLKVSGTMPQLTKLLSLLHSEEKLTHTRQLVVRPSGRGGVELEMQLELVLFDLIKKQPKHAA